MIVRDADHPGNILLYSGQFLDLKKSFDVVINPLCGAAEIGYAIQEIGSVFGKNSIKKVELLRYCVYEERQDITLNHVPLTTFIPKSLTSSFEESIKKENIIIIDDGIFQGQTMKGLKNYLKTNYEIIPKISSIDFSLEDNLIKISETFVSPIADRNITQMGHEIRIQIEKPLDKLKTINILLENNEITQEVYNKTYEKLQPKII
jgi:predicted transcriptional regulator